MNIAIAGKKIGSEIANIIGINDLLLKIKYSGKVVILTYHRVINTGDVEECMQSGMYVETKTFEKQLKFIKKNFNNIPISEIPFVIHKGRQRNGNDGKAFVVLTFDDGWADFYKNAYPLIKKENMYATVFLPTNYIDSNNMFWTDRIGYLISRRIEDIHLKESKNGIIRDMERLTGNTGTKIENSIKIMKNLTTDEIQDTITTLCDRWKITFDKTNRAFLSWDEVRDMYKSGNIMIGSHTENHPILTNLKEAHVLQELSNSMEQLMGKGVVGRSFIPFSYPNGDYNDRIVEMVKRAGYNLAVTTKNGWNIPAVEADLFRLRRISIHQDMTSTESMFSSRILNII